jgi:hypothetical protein
LSKQDGRVKTGHDGGEEVPITRMLLMSVRLGMPAKAGVGV